MSVIESRLDIGSGESLLLRSWPCSLAKARVLLVHGAGEHCGRYQRFAARLNAAGYSVYSFDLPGHGESVGQLGHIDSFNDYMNALAAVQQRLQQESDAGLPCFLMGHSMGGLIALRYLQNGAQGFAGCVLSAPLVETDAAPGALLSMLLAVLARCFPRLPMQALDAAGVSRDPKVVQDYIDDPLVFSGKLTTGFLQSLFTAMADLKHQGISFDVPILLLHGAADVMTAPQGSRWVYDNVGSSDKTHVEYPGLFHEILNEPEQEAVYADLLKWLEARC